jgi:hypothetical protein
MADSGGVARMRGLSCSKVDMQTEAGTREAAER